MIYTHLRKVNKNKVSIFQPAIPVQGCVRQLTGCKAGHPGQDALPPQGRTRLTFSQLRQIGHATSPNVHISGTWEEIGLPGEKTQGECGNSTRAVAMARN